MKRKATEDINEQNIFKKVPKTDNNNPLPEHKDPVSTECIVDITSSPNMEDAVSTNFTTTDSKLGQSALWISKSTANTTVPVKKEEPDSELSKLIHSFKNTAIVERISLIVRRREKDNNNSDAIPDRNLKNFKKFRKVGIWLNVMFLA